jgi:hypothetical protein
MSATVMFVLFAIAFLSLFAVLAFRRTRGIPDFDSTVATIQSLDVEAFRNLVDPDEDAFLRAHLPPGKFRTLQRERARAALAYAKELSRAGLQFTRIADVARRSPDPEVAAWGKQVADSAIELRISALRASVRLAVAAAFPGLRLRSSHPLFEHYARAVRLVLTPDALQRVQIPAA